jgi:hypothetical protein
MNMGNLYRLSDGKSRSISPENYTGEKGKAGMADPADKDKPNIANAASAARDLGQGWKYFKIGSMAQRYNGAKVQRCNGTTAQRNVIKTIPYISPPKKVSLRTK